MHIRSLVCVLLASVVLGCAQPSLLTNKNRLTSEDVQKLSLALTGENLPAIQAIFAKLPADREQWSISDSGLVSQAYAMEIAKGEKCKTEIMDYLLTLTPGVEWEYIERNAKRPERYENSVFCANYLRSFYDFAIDRDPENAALPALRESRLESVVKGTVNAFIQYLNHNLRLNDPKISKQLDIYFDWFRYAQKHGKAACAASSLSKGCLALGLYKKAAEDMKTKLDVKKAPYAKKIAEIQKFLETAND